MVVKSCLETVFEIENEIVRLMVSLANDNYIAIVYRSTQNSKFIFYIANFSFKYAWFSD